MIAERGGAEKNMKFYCLVLLILLTACLHAAPRLPFGEGAMLEPGRENRLRFADGAGADYKICDIMGKTLHAGTLNGEGELKLNLPQGFYEMVFPGHRVGLYVSQARQGIPDPFWGMQTDISRRERKQGMAVIDSVIRLLARTGIGTMRDYRSWREDEPLPGKLRPGSDSTFQRVASTPVRILHYLADAPLWQLGPEGRQEKGASIYPRHLLSLERSLRLLLPHREPGMVGWQIENETTNRPYPPDVTLAEINACSFLAGRIGLKQPIVTPGFARPHADELGGYTEAGLVELCDVFALHVYQPPEKMRESVAIARQVLAKTSKPGMPLWITETGYAWSAGNVKNPSFRGGDGRKRALPADDMESAVSLIRSAWIARACGVAKFIPFRLVFCQEYSVNFGLLDLDGSPQRNFAAYAFAVQCLSGKRYIGELAAPPRNWESAMVFAAEDSAVIAGYVPGGKTGPRDWKNLPVKKALRIDGSVPGNGDSPEWGKIVYLFCSAAEIEKLVYRDTPEGELLKIAENYRERPRTPFPVTTQFSHWQFDWKTNLYYVATPEKLEFHWYNLSDHALPVEPELLLPEGGRIVSAAEPLPDSIPAGTKISRSWGVDLKPCRGTIRRVVLRDRRGNASPVTLRFLDTTSLTREPLVGAREVKNWHANAAGKMTIQTVPEEGAIRFHTRFSPSGWAYPEYFLNLPKESLQDVIAISFEIRAKKFGDRRYPYSKVQFVHDRSRNDFSQVDYPPPTPEWSSRMVIVPESVRMRPVYRLRIGLGTAETEMEFQLRNIRLLRIPR